MFQSLQLRFARATAPTGQRQTSEPIEFEVKYARLLQARDALKRVEASLRLHLKKNQAMVKQAKLLGKSLGTPDAELKRLDDELNTSLEDDTLLLAINSKIQLLDDTVKQRRKLEDMRLARDHHYQRLQQLVSKKHSAGGAEEQRLQQEVDKRQAKLDQAQSDYDVHLAELSDALEFIDEQTSRDGPWTLIASEMEAFRAASQRSATNVQLLFAGSPAGKYTRDAEAEKLAVREEQARIESGMYDAVNSPKSKQAEEEDD